MKISAQRRASPGVVAATGSSSAAGTAGRGGVTAFAASTPSAGTQGRGGIASVPATTAGVAAQAQPTSSGSSGTTTWIWVGVALAVLAGSVAAWAVFRRRRAQGEPSSEYCSTHPDDALCRAA